MARSSHFRAQPVEFAPAKGRISGTALKSYSGALHGHLGFFRLMLPCRELHAHVAFHVEPGAGTAAVAFRPEAYEACPWRADQQLIEPRSGNGSLLSSQSPIHVGGISCRSWPLSYAQQFSGQQRGNGQRSTCSRTRVRYLRYARAGERRVVYSKVGRKPGTSC
jgi:hypothetical protein